MSLVLNTVTGMSEIFRSIFKQQLSSVEFVQNYLQLHFDGKSITYYVWPTITVDAKIYKIDDTGYRDAMCKIITQEVDRIEFVEDKSLTLYFDNTAQIFLSLVRNESNTDIVEFIYFRGLDSEWFVLD